MGRPADARVGPCGLLQFQPSENLGRTGAHLGGPSAGSHSPGKVKALAHFLGLM